MSKPTGVPELAVREATEEDVPLILGLIKELAEYERLAHEVVADENDLRKYLFGEGSFVEVLIGCYKEKPAGFALFFPNFSTFLGQPGIYLEDIYVRPEYRGKGLGKALLSEVAKSAVKRNCGRLEWSVLDWNKPAIEFYNSLGAIPMEDWTTFRITGEKLNILAGQ